LPVFPDFSPPPHDHHHHRTAHSRSHPTQTAQLGSAAPPCCRRHRPIPGAAPPSRRRSPPDAAPTPAPLRPPDAAPPSLAPHLPRDVDLLPTRQAPHHP